MGSTKAQSAIEFLTTYAFVFLIITVVLVLLIMFSSIPKSTLPFTCAFYSGFQCLDTELAVNSSGAPTLLIMASDSEPGTVNISSFSAYLNFHNSKSGYCTPVVAQAGEEIYCIANFTGSVTLGSVYSGTFKIFANYCAPPPSNTTGYCASGSTYIYTGNIRVQATKFVLSNSYYLPISVTNNQGSAVPAQFQQMIEFKPSTYALEEGSNLGNIRFYFGSKELYSWCESNCSSSAAGNAIFWVKTPQAIPPGQTMTIDMYFLPKSVQYDGVYAGEAPQLSPTYAEYDNGANVFNNYWNFAGTSLPSEFTSYASSGTTLTVDNSLTVSTGSGSAGGIVGISGFTPPVISEAYITSQSGGAESGGIAQQIGNVATSGGYDFNGWGGSVGSGSLENGMSGTQNINLQVLVPGIDGQAWTSSSTQYYYKNYGVSAASSTDYALPSTIYISAGVYCCSGSNLLTIQWLRVRAYPPNGVMPSVTFGTLTPV